MMEVQGGKHSLNRHVTMSGTFRVGGRHTRCSVFLWGPYSYLYDAFLVRSGRFEVMSREM